MHEHEQDRDQQHDRQPPGRGRRWVRSAALVGSGVVAGGILAGTLTANAAEDDAPTSTDGVSAECADGRGAGPGGHGEELTGETAASVEEAVLAEFPDATIGRLHTDPDGAYEAHILTAADERITVELGESFAITGTETHDGAGPGRGAGRGPGGGAGPGHGHHAAEGDAADDGTTDDGTATD